MVILRTSAILREADRLLADVVEGYELIAGTGTAGTFSEREKYLARKKARRAVKASPPILAGVRAYKLLCHARGRTLKVHDSEISEVVTDFVRDNEVLFDPLKRMALEEKLWSDAVLVFRFFFSSDHTLVRLVQIDEITRKITDPDDSATTWLYKRCYTQTSLSGESEEVTVYYPDINFNPTNVLKKRLEKHFQKINWDSPIYYVEINDGLTPCFAALHWAQLYERLLNMIATVYSAISQLAIHIQAESEEVGEIADQIEDMPDDEYGHTGVFDAEVKTLNAKSALMPSSDLKIYIGMIAMTFSLSPHMFGGEEKGGGLGSDQFRHESMNLALEARQMLWASVERKLISCVLKHSVEHGQLKHSGHRIVRFEINQNQISRIQWKKGTNEAIDITYPPIRKKDAEKYIRAIISALTLDGKKPLDLIPPKTVFQMFAEVLPLGDVDVHLQNLPDKWTDDGQIVAEGYKPTAIDTLQAVTEKLRTMLREAYRESGQRSTT